MDVPAPCKQDLAIRPSSGAPPSTTVRRSESRVRPARSIPSDSPGRGSDDRNLPVRPVGIGVVVEQGRVRQRRREIDAGAHKPTPDIRLRDIMTAERGPVSDTVERLIAPGRSDRTLTIRDLYIGEVKYHWSIPA